MAQNKVEMWLGDIEIKYVCLVWFTDSSSSLEEQTIHCINDWFLGYTLYGWKFQNEHFVRKWTTFVDVTVFHQLWNISVLSSLMRKCLLAVRFTSVLLSEVEKEINDITVVKWYTYCLLTRFCTIKWLWVVSFPARNVVAFALLLKAYIVLP